MNGTESTNHQSGEIQLYDGGFYFAYFLAKLKNGTVLDNKENIFVFFVFCSLVAAKREMEHLVFVSGSLHLDLCFT